MVQRIEPVKTIVVSKDGECKVTIELELNINLNSDGLSIQSEVKPHIEKEKKDFDKVDYIIPDLSSGFTVDLGK